MQACELNIFQRLARRWESVHPYNAAQVMRLAARADARLAGQAWAETLTTLGLGRVRVFDNSRFHHELLNGEMARYPLRMLPSDTCLDAHLTSELNRAFDDPDEPPFRPFLLCKENDSYFGVVYQHWVADSVSIRSVLREWFARMYAPAAARHAPLRQSPPGYWDLFGTEGNWRLDETLLAGFRTHMRHRRVRKVRSAGPHDYPVRVSLHRAPDGLSDALLRYSRSQGVKVHDVLLAALVEACHRHVPVQPRRNRPDLSVGSIVDLRPRACRELDDTFGLFLGFTHVVCRPRDVEDWPTLLRRVAAQNRAHKNNGLAQASMIWMLAALAVAPLVPDDKLYAFYRKEMPMAGGLSNVTLNDTWAARFQPQPLREYIRVSPTGPLVPLVFSTTTLGGSLNLAMTCRQSLLCAETADRMAAGFLNRLDNVSHLATAVDNLPAK